VRPETGKFWEEMMKRFAVAALILLAGCSSGLNRPVKEVTATTGTDNVQHVTVSAHSFYFDPNRIVVKRGVPVELKIKNAAWFVPHNLTSNVDTTKSIAIDQGLGMLHGSKTVHFTPTEVGEYAFYCHVDGHAGKGMTGVIVVKE
jgi:plastocyanin